MFMSMFTASENTVTFHKYYDGTGSYLRWVNSVRYKYNTVVQIVVVRVFKTTRGVQTGCW